MNVTERILYLVPNARFMCWENDYNQVIWYPGNTKPLPTLAELEAISQADIDAENPLIQRRKDIEINLPSWIEVSSTVDAVSNLAEAKVVLKKLARVVYWLAKNTKG